MPAPCRGCLTCPAPELSFSLSYSRRLSVLGLHSTAGAHALPVCRIASGVQEGLVQRVTIPPSPPIPKQGHCRCHQEPQHRSPSSPCLQRTGQGWKVFGAGEKHQRNSKCYFESPNNPNYQIIPKLPQIITSYQDRTTLQTPLQRLLGPGIWRSPPPCCSHRCFFPGSCLNYRLSFRAGTKPTGCPWPASTLVCERAGELDRLHAFFASLQLQNGKKSQARA